MANRGRRPEQRLITPEMLYPELRADQEPHSVASDGRKPSGGPNTPPDGRAPASKRSGAPASSRDAMSQLGALAAHFRTPERAEPAPIYPEKDS